MENETQNRQLEEFGHKLKMLRLDARLTQPQLAEKSNGKLTVTTIVALEKGKYGCRTHVVLKYLETLGYEIKFEKKN